MNLVINSPTETIRCNSISNSITLPISTMSTTASSLSNLAMSSPLRFRNILNDRNSTENVNGSGNTIIRQHKSAFLPYKPQSIVLTNVQRGNTEATFCPVEVKLSFHGLCGQGEISEDQINLIKQQQQQNIDFTDTDGFSPLHWACHYGQLATAQSLVEAGADVNKQAPELSTPLLLAAAGGHHEIVRFLLDNGASVSHMDIVGNTALMYAAAGNHPHTCNELLSRNPDVTVTNENGDTAYTLALEYGATLSQAVLEHYITGLLTI